MTHRALITQMLDCIATLRHSSNSFAGDKKAAEAMQAAREYLAAPEQSEPICYASINKQGDVCSTLKQRDSWRTVPLYTHPAPGAKQEPVKTSGLPFVIKWLENGCNVPDAVAELKLIEAKTRHPTPQPEPVTITQALNAPGCERIKDYYKVGPVQRAAVESFATALGHGEPVGFFYFDDGQWKQAHDPISFPTCTKLFTHPAPNPKQPVNQMLLEALKLALDCHGKMILSDPPQAA